MSHRPTFTEIISFLEKFAGKNIKFLSLNVLYFFQEIFPCLRMWFLMRFISYYFRCRSQLFGFVNNTG